MSTDLALEWAEDQLLDQVCEGNACRHYELGDLDVFEDFSNDELEKIEALLDKDTLKKMRSSLKRVIPTGICISLRGGRSV